MAATLIENMASLTCISGGYILEGRAESTKPYTQVTKKLYERVVTSERAARSIYAALFNQKRSSAQSAESADGISSIISFTNPRYLEWTSEVYEDFELFRNHAIKVHDVYRTPIDRYVSRVSCPSLFIVGSGDDFVDPAVTGEVAGRIQGSQRFEIDQGDHWIIHSDARVASKVSEFLSSVRAAHDQGRSVPQSQQAS